VSIRPAGLLTGLRLAYGSVLLAAPGPVVQAAAGQPADTRARRVTRVLGARHLLQGIGTVGRPGPDVVGLGAEVDLVHAATALAWGCSTVTVAGRGWSTRSWRPRSPWPA